MTSSIQAVTKSLPTSSAPGIVWGAGALAATSAFALVIAQKKREDEERRAAEAAKRENKKAEAAEKAREEAIKVQNYLQGKAMLNNALKNSGLSVAEQEKIRKEARQKGMEVGLNATVVAIQAQKVRDEAIKAQMNRFDADEKRRSEQEQAEAEQKAYQDWLRTGKNPPPGMEDVTEVERLAMYQQTPGYQAYQKQSTTWAAFRQQEQASHGSNSVKEKAWWEKAIDFVDQHQTEIALGVGVVAGIAAIILTAGAATPLVAAGMVALTTVAAGGLVAAGTVGLNSYYGRPLDTNVWKNTFTTAVTTLVTYGAGELLIAGFYKAGSALGAVCAAYPDTCARFDQVLNVMDKVEELGLTAKAAIQTYLGDRDGAAETLAELAAERADGGMPGDTLAKEVASEVAEAVASHSDDVARLTTKLLEGTTPEAAEKIAKALDDETLEYVVEQGPEAINALSKWLEQDWFKKLAPDEAAKVLQELALRAGEDAKVLRDVRKLTSLGPIDPDHLTTEQKALIDAIAANSTTLANTGKGGQVALGKWVDGYMGGYAGYAHDTASINYYAHPDMWHLLGELGDEGQAEAAWLINKQAIQPMIDQGLPFEYTLTGIADAAKEDKAIKAIWSDATDATIAKILNPDRKDLPGRIKELKELYEAGYQFSFDASTNTYILIKP